MSEGSKSKTDKFKVFVSYAREDLEFADQLVDALIAAGFEPLIDRNRMIGGEEFRDRLSALIRECDTVAFVISPDSVDPNSFCTWEVAEANRYSKRMIPVLFKPLGDAVVPERLRNLDYIFFYSERHVPGSGFGNGLARLVNALNSDLEWLQQHTVLLGRASLWNTRGRDDDSLLRGALLGEAEKWLANRPATAPEITEVQREYLEASRRAEEASTNAARQRLEEMRLAHEAREKALREAEVALAGARDAAAAREAAQKQEAAALARAADEQQARARAQQRAARLFAAIAALVLLTFAGALWQVYATAQREVRVFTSVAEAAFSNGYCDRALRLAIAGLPAPGATILSPLSAELDAALSRYSSECLLQLALDVDQSAITDATWSPDGQTIATVSDDRIVRLWAPTTGFVVTASKPASSDLGRVRFSPDGKTLLVVGNDSSFTLDSSTLGLIATFKENEGPIRSAAFSPDGSRVLGSPQAGNTIKIWDARTGEPLVQMKGHADTVLSARFSPDGSTVLTSSRDDTVRIWDAVSGAESRTIKTPYLVWNAVFSPDGQKIATHELLNIRIFDAKSGERLGAVGKSGTTGSSTENGLFAFSPDGSKLLTALLDRHVISWDAVTGAVTAEFKGHTDFATSLAISPDGSRLLTSSTDGTARIWDAKSGSPIEVLRGHFGGVRAARWSPDGRRALTWADDGQVRVWYTSAPSAVHLAAMPRKFDLAVASKDGNWIAVADESGSPRIIDVATGKAAVENPAAGGRIVSLEVSGNSRRVAWLNDRGVMIVFDVYSKSVVNSWPALLIENDAKPRAQPIFLNEDGTLVAVGVGNTCRVFDVATGKMVALLEGHTGDIRAAGFSSDGKQLVTGAEDKSARLWNLETGKEIANLAGHRHYVTSAAFTPDQNVIVTTSLFADETIFWNAHTGAKIKEYDGSSHGDIGRSFSKSGKLLAIGNDAHQVTVIDLTDYSIRNTLTGHENSVSSVVFGHNDRWLASTSTDGTARVWDLASGEQLQKFDGLDPERSFAIGFLANDTRLIANDSFGGRDVKIFAMSPALTMSALERWNYVCETSLQGMQAFRGDEMEDIILRGRGSLQNPCRRRGPLSLAYYRQAAEDSWQWIKSVFNPRPKTSTAPGQHAD
jgi:WD40 repeat protein